MQVAILKAQSKALEEKLAKNKGGDKSDEIVSTSILENAAKLDFPVPDKLKDVLS